jgi:hypothetical protein
MYIDGGGTGIFSSRCKVLGGRLYEYRGPRLPDRTLINVSFNEAPTRTDPELGRIIQSTRFLWIYATIGLGSHVSFKLHILPLTNHLRT